MSNDFSGVTMTRTIFNESLVTRKPQQTGDVGLEADDGDFDPEDKQLVYTTTPPQTQRAEPTTTLI